MQVMLDSIRFDGKEEVHLHSNLMSNSLPFCNRNLIKNGSSNLDYTFTSKTFFFFFVTYTFLPNVLSLAQIFFFSLGLDSS